MVRDLEGSDSARNLPEQLINSNWEVLGAFYLILPRFDPHLLPKDAQYWTSIIDVGLETLPCVSLNNRDCLSVYNTR